VLFAHRIHQRQGRLDLRCATRHHLDVAIKALAPTGKIVEITFQLEQRLQLNLHLCAPPLYPTRQEVVIMHFGIEFLRSETAALPHPLRPARHVRLLDSHDGG
jgi:hypothetical protein